MMEIDDNWQRRLRNARNKLGVRSWRDYVETPAAERFASIIRDRRAAQSDDVFFGRDVDTGNPLYISRRALRRHLYIVGTSGSGKTTLIKQLIEQHIKRNEGFAVIDPKGGLLEHIKERIACAYHRTQDEELLEKLVAVDPKHPTHTVTFNPLEPLPNTSSVELASELVTTFHKIWSDWGNRMEDLMRNSFIAAAEAGLTLVDLLRFYNDEDFRAETMSRVRHPDVIDYFQSGGEFDSYTHTRAAATSVLGPVRQKLRAFLADERVRQMLSFPQSSFNIRDIMDNRKILVIALDGLRDATWLLSALFMSKITLAIKSRADTPEEYRVPFYLYVDEFAEFANEDFKNVLALARSFGLSIIMAHQNYSQLASTNLRADAMGNAQLRVAFRLGEKSDADYFARQIFTYDEDEIKRERELQSGEVSYTYRSAGEQRDRLAEAITRQPDLAFYIQDKLSHRVMRAKTAHLPPASQELRMSKAEAADYIDKLPLGRQYLVDREEIKRYQSQRAAVVADPPSTSSDQSASDLAEGFGDTKPATLPRRPT